MLVIAVLRWTAGTTTAAAPVGLTEADECVLEYALRTAAELGARCAAAAVGSADIDAMLRQASAAGADEVLRIDPPHEAESAAEDADATARALLRVITSRFGAADLVLCADQASDGNANAVPAYLAARSNAAQALGILDLRAGDETLPSGALRAVRRLDGGRREVLAVPLPAVCSVEPTGLRLRRAPLPAVIAAQTAEIPVVRLPSQDPVSRESSTRSVQVGPARAYRPRPRVIATPSAPSARARILTLTSALERPVARRLITPSDPTEAVDELVAYLQQHGYLSTDAP